MKKFLVVLMALLFATGAFAQEAEKKAAEFKYGFKGFAYGVTGAHDDMEYDYTHIRVRPMFTMGNDNVKGVVQLEFDQDFGKITTQAEDADPVADPNGAAVSTRNKGIAELRLAYIDVQNFFVQNLSYRMGLDYYFFPMVMDNPAALTQVAYDFGMGKAILSYIKINEDTKIENTAEDVETTTDSQIYALDLPIKAGAITVRPGVMFLQAEDLYTVNLEIGDETLAGSEVSLTNAAINVNGEMGALGFDATLAYLTGEASDIDIAAYAADAQVTFKAAEGIKVGVFGTYTSGQDFTEDDIMAYDVVMDTIVGAPDGRLFIVEANGINANGGGEQLGLDMTDSIFGQMNFGLMVEAVFGKATVLAQYGYCSFAEDNGADEAFIGHEIDLKGAYEVAPATTFFVEFGYLTAGDDSINEEAAYEAAFGLETSI